MKNVQQVRGKWVARLTVPEELRPVIGLRELVEELPTEAKSRERRALAVLNSFHARLDEAREIVAANRTSPVIAATAHYNAELLADDQERVIPLESRAAYRPAYAIRLRLLVAGKIGGDEAEALIGYAADDLHRKGLAPDLPRPDLLRMLAEIQLEALARFEARDQGQIAPAAPTHPLLTAPAPTAPTVPTIPATGGKTLGDVLADFHKERSAGGRSLAQKTMEEHKVAVRLFEEVMGKGLPVRTLKKADLIKYKQALLEAPANYTKRFPGLTLPQAIKANQKREVPFETLNPKTINMKWLSHLSSILEWASNNGLVEYNPAKGVRVDTGKAAHKEPTRLPFTKAEMKSMFAAPIFADPKQYRTNEWAVLLALYTGARSSSEIARIRLDDIYEEQGILVFDLSGASKNTRSKRLVPVHPELIALGLNEYVTALRKAGETMLFPDWNPEDKVNRWFLRTFLPGVGIEDKRKVFHSLRHNLKTELVRSGCTKEISDLITGHRDQSVAADYVHDTPVKRMAEALALVSFAPHIPPLKSRP